MTWTARIIADDGCEQEATGITPERALIALITDVMNQWNRDELPLDGDFLTDMGAMMTEIETSDWEDDTVFTKNLGDFSLPSKLIVERNPCDQLGGGCTCEDCTKQITDAIGMDTTIYDCTPVPADHVYEDDCEKLPPVETPGDCPMGWDRV